MGGWGWGVARGSTPLWSYFLWFYNMNLLFSHSGFEPFILGLGRLCSKISNFAFEY